MAKLISETPLGMFAPFEPEFHIGRLVHLASWHHPRLSSSDWRFYYCTPNHAEIRLSTGDWQALDPKFVYLVPPETEFATRNRDHFRQLYVHFQLPTWRRSSSFAPQLIRARLAEAALRHRAILQNVAADIVPIPKDLLAIVTWALSYVPEDPASIEPPDAALRWVLEYTRITLQYNITNAQLAEQGGMSVNSLIRQFQRHLGMSPQQYLQRERIKRACRLLEFTSKTIEQVAEECGFCDRHYFSRIFRKQRGIGPAGFRKRFKETLDTP